MEFEEFSDLCKRGVCSRHTLLSSKCETLLKQKRCFDKWSIQQRNKKQIEIDDQWEFVRAEVWERDKGMCQLFCKLTSDTAEILYANAGNSIYEPDSAHYLGRGSYPEFKYTVANVVLLNRYSHGNLDKRLSPITGNPISQEQYEYWWEIILGKSNKRYMDILRDRRL